MGIISDVTLGGIGEGLMVSGKQLGEYAARSKIQEEAAEIQRLRDERLEQIAALREQRGYAHAKDMVEHTENVRTRKAVEAGEAATKAAGGYVDDLSGTVRPQSASEQAASRAAEFERRGLIDLSMREREAEDRRLERVTQGADRTQQRNLELARHEESMRHNKAQEETARRNATRLNSMADEQIKGIKLDNEQKQLLADVKSRYDAATDGVEKEKIAQELLLLTGKWGEAFDVKVGKDAMGNDVVLGYVDKRRGTFTKPDGTVTDMRSGKAVGGGSGATPTQEHIDALKKRSGDPAAVAAFEAQFGAGSAAKHLPPKKPGLPKTPANPNADGRTNLADEIDKRENSQEKKAARQRARDADAEFYRDKMPGTY